MPNGAGRVWPDSWRHARDILMIFCRISWKATCNNSSSSAPVMIRDRIVLTCRGMGSSAFEVDHPATQEDKLAKVKKIFGEPPSHVTYVPVDFNTQTLDQRLPESGYDRALKTLFIWQGVTMYLDPESVDATLAFVRHNSAPGSAIVFDYIHDEVLGGIQKHGEVNSMRRYRFMSGEDLIFGIPQGGATDFLKARGFSEILDVDADDLRQAYFAGSKSKRKVAGGYGIAIGKVEADAMVRPNPIERSE